ncbi:MAG TPA: hypothetical protein VF916_09980 [Ktedonobacterales bacterium]
MARRARRDIAAEMRAEQAATLRATERLTYAEIAKRVGYADEGRCHHAIWNWYDKHHAPEAAEQLRLSEGHLLDELQRKVWRLLDDDDLDLDAVAKLLAIATRRARLEGLDKQPEKQGTLLPGVVTNEYVNGDGEAL